MTQICSFLDCCILFGYNRCLIHSAFGSEYAFNQMHSVHYQVLLVSSIQITINVVCRPKRHDDESKVKEEERWRKVLDAEAREWFYVEPMHWMASSRGEDVEGES